MNGEPAKPPDSNDAAANDTAGVITRPPYIYLAALAIGLAVEFFFPLDLLPPALGLPLGLGLIAVAVLIIRACFREFRRAETEADPLKPTTAILTTGPYRYSRNPLYIGLNLILVGIGIAANSPWVIVLAVPALIILHYGVVRREERYLERKFGEAYLRYKRSVRRWF
jgi:protein-S-isoprenylcysteine O-methyltransferase Ste14